MYRWCGTIKKNSRLALDVVKAGMSLKKCAAIYSIPRATLRRHRGQKVKHPGTVRFGAFEPVLNSNFEHELAFQIQLMERALFGLITIHHHHHHQNF